MAKELDPDHFKLGVLLNLLNFAASEIAEKEHGPDAPLTPNQAQSVAQDVWGIVTRNFLYFDDHKGTLAAEYSKHRETMIKAVTETLLVAW